MRIRRNYRDEPLESLAPCNTPAPDGSLTCTKELGHLGWHTHAPSDTSWFMDSWAVDEFADTAEAAAVDPEPTMTAEEWAWIHEPRPSAESVPQPPGTIIPVRRWRFSRRRVDLEAINAFREHTNFEVTMYRLKFMEAQRQGKHYIHK